MPLSLQLAVNGTEEATCPVNIPASHPQHLPCVTRAEMVEHVHIPDPGFARRDKRAAGKLTYASSVDR